MFDSLGKCVLDSREVLFVEVILYELYDEGGFALVGKDGTFFSKLGRET